MSGPILPGETIGILGGGQLGRMLAFAAKRMGYRVHVLAPEEDPPVAGVVDRLYRVSYGDHEAVREFGESCRVVTIEFENVDERALRVLEEIVLVHPGSHVLATTRDRLREKEFLSRSGLPVAPYLSLSRGDDVEAVGRTVSFPAILKTTTGGYDGKGQIGIGAADGLPPALARLGGTAVLEERISLSSELSVIVARSSDGSLVAFPPIATRHRDGILDLAHLPSLLPAALEKEAMALAGHVAERLLVIGLICVEFFLDHGGRLLINELAPRPHNSGHLTIEACLPSQFEQHIRAVCGLPLLAPTDVRPAAMANLLGDLWQGGEPDWVSVLNVPGVALHLYGKKRPQVGRKMGHLTAVAGSAEAALSRIIEARERLV